MHEKAKNISLFLFGVSLLTGAFFMLSSGNTLFAQNEEAQASPPQAVQEQPEVKADIEVAATSSDSTIDVTPPSDVHAIEAQAGDSEVSLSWDTATDNTAVTGYKIYRGTASVKSKDGAYDLPVIPVGASTRYTVQNLTNDQSYYFTVTAVDDAGNESENYGLPEVNATPKSGLRLAAIEDDNRPPQVNKVEAEDIITVKVIFSEPVKLPLQNPESAFNIEKIEDKSILMVQNAEIDARDSKGETVLLTTAPQQEKAEYLVTAGIQIKDYYNNGVVSGTSDTGSFTGDQDGGPQEDLQAPQVTGGAADFNNRIAVNFSEKVVLGADPKEHFSIVKKGTTAELKVTYVSLSPDSKTAYLTTDSQQPVEYEVEVKGIRDEKGNLAQTSSTVVTGKGVSLTDLVPPEEVTRFVTKIKDAQQNIVELRWTPSKNSAGDLADQILYQSDDKTGQNFGTGTALGSDATAAEVQDLQAGSWYTFKITSKDASNNESKGTLSSIYLPQTGPGVVALGLTSVIMGLYARRRRRSQNRQAVHN